MRILIWSVVAAVSSTWALAALVDASEAETCKTKIRITKSGEGNVLVTTGDKSRGTSEETQNAKTVVICRAGDRQPVSLVVAGDDEADEDAGWLGVQIGSFVKNEQGKSEISGVVVLNIAEDSPAAEAGFERDDVIIEVNDEAIGDDVELLVARIRDAGSGGRMKFTVLRDGERRTLAATLGSRADMQGLTWAFESAPDAVLRDKLRTKMHVLLPDDAGWVLEDLADLDLDDLSGLPGRIMKILPKSQGKAVEVFMNDGGVTISTTVTEDGKSIRVQSTGDGEIVVTRSTEGQDDEVVTRYADEDELAAADKEAYDIYKGASSHVIVELEGGAHVPTLRFDTDVINDHIDDALKTFDIHLDDWTVDLEDIKEQMDSIGRDIMPQTIQLLGGKARRSIHENSDGTIEVIIRKGDNELVTHYSDAEDLRARDPETYTSYLELLEVDQDE